MEQQLSEFAAQKLRAKQPIEYPDRVLTLLIGRQACAARETWTAHLKELWNLESKHVLCHGFAAEYDAPIDSALDITHLSCGSWRSEDILSVNEAMRRLADQFAEQYLPNQVICAIVFADDLLADKASDLLSLMTSWYYDINSDDTMTVPRPILFVLLPDRTSMDADKAERAFALTDKLQSRRAEAIFNPNYKASPDKAYPLSFEGSMEVFLLDAPDVPDPVLADAACLLSPEVKTGAGMFLAAFDDLPGVYKHRLLLQMIACLHQLKDTGKSGKAASHNDIIKDLQQIVLEEDQRADFSRWMSHSCVMRCQPHPNMSEEDTYGTWLLDLTQQWCQMFEAQELPESRLLKLLEDCPVSELAEYKVALSSHEMQPSHRRSRGKPTARADSWQRCLNHAITNTYNDLRNKSHEKRLNSLVQRMLTLVSEKLENIGTSAESSTSNLLALLRHMERNTIRKSVFTPVEMDSNECVRFSQILLATGQGEQRNYGNLLAMVQQLVDKSVGTETEPLAVPRLCCGHNYLLDWRSRLQRCCQLPLGSRSGQILYTLRMSEKKSEMNLDRIRFFDHCNKYCRRDA